ncbi:MAG: hypothetical protein ACRYGM_01410 [Janthinobacterium lividum]
MLSLSAGLDLTVLGGGISGFAPGSAIDVSQVASSLVYSDALGTNTGGFITLQDQFGFTIGTLPLSTGEYTTSSFSLTPDGAGGTLVSFLSQVTGVSATPGNAALTTGGQATLTVAFSLPVTVAGGPPTLMLNDGGVAVYDAAASTATSLAFTYTVSAGENTPDLAVTGLALNGGTITDVNGVAAVLTGAAANPAGTLQVDTLVPTITGVTTNPATGVLGAGQIIAITVGLSEAVTVAGGTPTLTLSNGGIATYDPLASTGTSLVFTTTVAAGQNSADLTVTGITANGATIADGAGNAASLVGLVTNPAGVLVIDTVAPTVLGVTTNPATGAVAAGQSVSFTVATSEAVTIAGGVPTLSLSNGGVATYDPLASTGTSLVFTTTIAAGQNVPDLAITALNANGAAIADVAGNLADLTGAVINPPGVLAVDTIVPTVLGVTTNPVSGVLGAGRSVAITVTTSEAVTVAGTPVLVLNDGGTATYDPTASTATSLVFTSTVLAGQNTADLAVSAVGAGGTITDAAGNLLDLAAAVVNPAGVLVIDTVAPLVTTVTTNPASGVLGAGQTVAITVGTSEAVTVAGGTPTLALSDGGTATYDAAASTATSLVFTTTVLAGQNTADLAVTGVSLNGATIADAAGNVPNLAAAVGNPAGVLAIDTVAPLVTTVTTNPAAGVLGVGQTVAITLGTSEAVTVAGGTPTLTLSTGGVATYDPTASTANSLVFNATVTAGQNAADLAVTAFNGNGAVVADAAGNAADLSGALVNPAGVLVIDTLAPTVAGVTTNPGSGVLGAGQTVSFTVATSEAVTVVGGTPTLTLSDGGVATYDAAASGPTGLVFTTTIAAGQNAPDLAVTAVNANGAIIADAAGNAASLAAAVTNPAGVLVIDTLAPTVTGVVTNPGSGVLGTGQVVTITVGTSEAVSVVGGTPTLSLNDGGTAIYDAAASTATGLVFTTTVAAGQNSADLAITAFNANGAVVADAAGNVASLAAAVTNPAGTLVVDTVAPVVTGVATNPAAGTLGAGQVVAITVGTSEAVTVVGGTPTLTLSDGGTAVYDPTASTANSLVFTSTIAAGQNAADLAVTGINTNGAVIADAAGNGADLTGALANPAGVLVIDTIAPTVLGVSTNPAAGSVGVGQTIAITVGVSEGVIVAGGTPTLTLSNGGVATYDPAASTATGLVFTTTVAPGQNAADLAVTAVNTNGATIADAAGNAAGLTGAVTNPGGVLTTDTVAPTILGVTTSPGAGALGAGQVVAITVATSEAVTVTGGTPTLTLNDGGIAAYDASASTATSLVFTTTVLAGQNTADLAVTAISSNGAVIADAAGNLADLSGAVVNPAGVLAIDTVAPTVTGVATSPASGVLGVGQSVAFTVGTSEAVTVAGGTPTLTLSDGGTALYDAAASTATSLVFTATIAAGQTAADLAVTAVNANGAVIADAAGNPADLTGAISNPAGVLAVDGIAPTVLGVVTNPGSGVLGAGQTVVFTVGTSEAVTVTGGVPTLTLNDGGVATYDAAASTATSLVFTSTIAAGQNAADLAVTAVNGNGAVIADAAGNPADLSGAVTNPAGVLTVDTAAPTITAVSTSPASGTLGAGQVVAITLSTSEAVVIAGGTPTLTLSDGGTATYDPAASTGTSLVFTTTIAAGQNTADLAVTAINTNGASIADAAGNAAVLAGAVTNPAGVVVVDTAAPVITGVSTNPGSGAVGAGQVVAITLTPSESVTVAGGTPTLTLSDGGVATYDPTASTGTSLVFTTTIAPGQSTPDLAVVAVNGNGATITDAAGNPADLSGAVTNPAGVLTVDTTAPTIPGVTTNPGSGTVAAGTPIVITVGTSEPVTVTGGPPSLSLNNGGTATYVPAGSPTTGLQFTYTPAPGDDVGDLAVTGLNLNGGRITDQAGNAIDLSGAAVNPAGTLVVNTSINPFIPLSVSGADGSAIVTVTAATRPGVTGTYGNLGGGSIGADGITYTVSGTIAQVNAALAGVTLVPARGSAAIAGYTAAVSDGTPGLNSQLTNGSGLGSALSAVTAGAAVRAGSGADTLLGGSAAGTVLVGGSGADVLVGSTAGGTLLGGTGSSTFFSQGGATLIVGGGRQDVVSASAGSPTVFSAVGGRTVIGTGSGAAVVVDKGQDTVIGSSGTLLVAMNAQSIAFGGSGAATYLATDGSTVVGGSGSSLVGITGGGALVYGGGGPTTFIGGSGSSTVIGGTGGGNRLFAGAGGGVFNAGSGGNSILVGGQQATTLFGGGSGDVLFASGSAGTVLVAGSGNQTLQGGGSSGKDTFFLGSGNTLVGLGAGQDAVFAGSGAATVVAGSGADVFAFVNGRAGGSESIIGFKAGTDKISLQGYAGDEVARASAGAVVSAGNATTAPSTTITLSDNTRITFMGTSSLPTNVFS